MSNYSTFCLFSQFNVLSSMHPHPTTTAATTLPVGLALCKELYYPAGDSGWECGGADGTLGKHQHICHSLSL